MTDAPMTLDARRIDDLEQLILTVPQVDLQTQHALAGGVYARLAALQFLT